MSIHLETRAVLAGAYLTVKTVLTHAVEVTTSGDDVRVLCGRVRLESLADPNAGDVTAAPTCALCAKRLVKRSSG